ncbi:MAG: hypothetical protein L3J51_07520 [Cocleimonas sp.]|nr:hypothetical protein [Cocleimonas sp.]
MFDSKDNQYAVSIDLKGKPLSVDELVLKHSRLKYFYKSNLSFILAIFVLGAAVTYRAIMLDYDKEHELFNISLYVGLWFGLFTGVMIDGDARRKFQMVVVGITISASSGLFASMLVMLMLGQATVWITSVNILASALACMWVLTRYDEVLKGIESIHYVDQKQFSYIQKASSHFEELYTFSEKIIAENRLPLTCEYWAYRDWVKAKAALNKP